ncbi:hypothetical protein KSB_04980 [Ktedonobacter robiniae]|uniref:Uncharacterized protein n=1 Tax=Ktedonobacter robiniae TaxID=2778365 RepID=A0ABQ3UH71_9CHLR|nr:hypothetical protein KSB_04980 [Ktedonobacter robiniae]
MLLVKWVSLIAGGKEERGLGGSSCGSFHRVVSLDAAFPAFWVLLGHIGLNRRRAKA